MKLRVCAQSSCVALVLVGSVASAVTMDWTPIGNPGNACDAQPQGCFGAVPYTYQIGTYEVTKAQYAEFLNAVASVSDPHFLSSDGFIVRSGAPGAYSYAPEPGSENTPVAGLSVFSAQRFANWMSNGQGSGDTETGSYTFSGTQSDAAVRNPGATIVLASENEWYKAAYYDAVTTSYFDFPTSSNTQPFCTWRPLERVQPNTANCGPINAPLLPVGTYIASASPYGTFDQGGNAWEWTDTLTFGCPAPFPCQGLNRVLRGGSAGDGVFNLAADTRNFAYPIFEGPGFRLAMVPEPGTGVLVTLGLLGLARRRGPN